MSDWLSVVDIDREESRDAARDADDYTDRPTRRELEQEERDCRD